MKFDDIWDSTMKIKYIKSKVVSKSWTDHKLLVCVETNVID